MITIKENSSHYAIVSLEKSRDTFVDLSYINPLKETINIGDNVVIIAVSYACAFFIKESKLCPISGITYCKDDKKGYKKHLVFKVAGFGDRLPISIPENIRNNDKVELPTNDIILTNKTGHIVYTNKRFVLKIDKKWLK